MSRSRAIVDAETPRKVFQAFTGNRQYFGKRTHPNRYDTPVLSPWGVPNVTVVRDETEGPIPLEIEPSLRITRHSPTGFEWGYPGSGPHQLALALLYDATGSITRAEMAHHDFAVSVVANLPKLEWHLSSGQIKGWLDAWENQPV